ISFEEIGASIARDWNFPRRIVNSMMKMLPSELSKNQNYEDKLRAISTFSHDISNAISTYPSISDRENAINKIIDVYDVHFKSYRNIINDVIKSSADDFLQFCNIFDIDLQRSQFSMNVLQARDKQDDRKTKVSDESVSSGGGIGTIDEIMEIDSFEKPEDIFTKGIQDINKSLLSGFSLNDVIRVVLETMYRGLQLSQDAKVLFIIKDTKRPVMVVRYGFGADINETKEWFVISIDSSDDIFSRAIKNQKDLIIKNIALQEIANILPDWYKKRIKGELFVILLPIVISGVTIGLYYIEGKRHDMSNLSNMHLNNLKILRDQTVMAIKHKRGF
ncbi:MAG: hypothetical protein SNJ53_06250, partial [Thermodesulfovibrionales bacterium]